MSERLSRFIDDVAELLKLNEDISKRLETEHGWTAVTISKHREDIDERILLQHSLKAQILKLKTCNHRWSFSEPRKCLTCGELLSPTT